MPGDRFSRQSFLGPDSPMVLGTARVGIVGLGGGGSHVAQQFAHLGIANFVIYDADKIEDSNLNRLVGGTEMDVAMAMPKVLIGERLIRGVVPKAHVERIQSRWQEIPDPLRSCDLLVGCVDSYRERWELQVLSRRFYIPYIDIGLGVSDVGDEGPKMRGQVIVTVPGGPCMKCIGFLNDENLAKEAAGYGDTGPRPQVVWANGVLASTAVGFAVDLLTGWTRSRPNNDVVYVSYDGNTGVIEPDKRLLYVTSPHCPHFDSEDVGVPALRAI